MANGTKAFEDTIKSYLDNKATEDPLFAEKYNNEKKSIKECCSFIISEVQRMNVCGLTDDEVYGLAVHYYCEDIKDIKETNCRVVVNHVVELTEEEKQQAKQDAINQVKQQEIQRLTTKKKPETKPEETTQQTQLSLF